MGPSQFCPDAGKFCLNTDLLRLGGSLLKLCSAQAAKCPACSSSPNCLHISSSAVAPDSRTKAALQASVIDADMLYSMRVPIRRSSSEVASDSTNPLVLADRSFVVSFISQSCVTLWMMSSSAKCSRAILEYERLWMARAVARRISAHMIALPLSSASSGSDDPKKPSDDLNLISITSGRCPAARCTHFRAHCTTSDCKIAAIDVLVVHCKVNALIPISSVEPLGKVSTGRPPGN